MSRHGPDARTVPHSGFPRWKPPSRMGVDGSCDGVSGASVSFNSGFSAAC